MTKAEQRFVYSLYFMSPNYRGGPLSAKIYIID